MPAPALLSSDGTLWLAYRIARDPHHCAVVRFLQVEHYAWGPSPAVHGPEQADRPPQGGFYQAPVLLRDVPASHRLAQEEVFGPVLAALPFDSEAAARYGTLVALTLAVGRDPRPRRLDLMIAAIASTHGLPLYTRNAGDFKGLEDRVTVIAV